MASILTQNSNDKGLERIQKYSISSDDSSHLADEDEKFYDAIDDQIQLLNGLNIGVSDASNVSTSSPSSISPNENSSSNCEHNENKVLENDDVNSNNNNNDGAELETPWTLWFDR